MQAIGAAEGAEVAVPRRLDLKTILQQFLDFRLEVVTRRLRFELKNLLDRIHILEGFAIVFKNLDEAIQIIRASNGKADAAPKLMERFELSDLQADAILDSKGVFTVPDILGNAGGVTVSYFEWVQDRQGFFWRESEVNERLMDIMVNAFDVVVKYAEKHKVNNRIAAYMVAIDRVAKALKMRGIYA